MLQQPNPLVPTLPQSQQGTKYITATDTLEVDERRVHTDASAGAITLTLPPVSRATGVYTICSITVGNAVTLTTYEGADGSYDWTNLTLDTAGDKVALISDGFQWFVICNSIT